MNVEMKLGRWEARSGNIFDVHRHTPDAVYQWRGDNGMCWMSSGAYWDDERPSQFDLIHYLGPVELSPTPACADQAGTPVVSTVSTETAGEQLQRMRERYNAMDREASIYSALLAALDQAKSDLGEHVRAIEKEHDL